MRFIIYIPLFLILITPAIYSRHLAYGVNTGKFFWMFFFSIALMPVLLHEVFSKKKTRLTYTDIFISLLLLYSIGHTYFNFHDVANKKLIFWCCSGLVYFAIR